VALGEIAAACLSPAADEAVKALESRKPGKVPTLQRLLADGAASCLVGPFIAAEAAGKKEAAAALAQAWLAYLAAMQARQAVDERKLVEVAIEVSIQEKTLKHPRQRCVRVTICGHQCQTAQPCLAAAARQIYSP